MRGGRKNLHVRLSDEAWQGFARFAYYEGVTVTALIEVLGRYLAEPESISKISEVELAHRARRIDGAHRSRTD